MALAQSNDTFIYGKHAVLEALKYAPQSIQKMYLAGYFEDVEIKGLIRKNNLSIENLGKGSIPRAIYEDLEQVAHQGIVARVVSDQLVRPYKEFMDNLKVDENSVVLILGELQDPQNVGAIIRSAGAFNVSAIFIPEHNQAPVTGTVVKVSAGMAFRVPLVTVGNVNTTLKDLKDKGFWIYGLAGDTTQIITKETFDAPTAFVLGSENEGLREKTREACDKILSIPIDAQCESLNVAVAASIALFSWSKDHPQALKKSVK